jgi:AcrR family transcriptional regulator
MATDATRQTKIGRRGSAPETRERILDIALELFTEQGYEKTSLRDIAERLGTTKAAIYYHFERKEDILLELHLRLHAFGRGLIAELEQLPDDRARLEAWPQMLGRFIEQVAGSRELIRMHQRNPTALHALEDNDRHRAENAEFEEQIRGLLSSPTIDPAMRVRLLCSLGAVFAGLLGADLLGDVSDEQLPGLVRDIVVGMFPG